eukprot:scaffold132830_cov14-Tisochrysis_lutea.AAC.1
MVERKSRRPGAWLATSRLPLALIGFVLRSTTPKSAALLMSKVQLRNPILSLWPSIYAHCHALRGPCPPPVQASLELRIMTYSVCQIKKAVEALAIQLHMQAAAVRATT